MLPCSEVKIMVNLTCKQRMSWMKHLNTAVWISKSTKIVCLTERRAIKNSTQRTSQSALYLTRLQWLDSNIATWCFAEQPKRCCLVVIGSPSQINRLVMLLHKLIRSERIMGQSITRATLKYLLVRHQLQSALTLMRIMRCTKRRLRQWYSQQWKQLRLTKSWICWASRK